MTYRTSVSNSKAQRATPKIYARNRILRGDCTERMEKLPAESIDLIVTDPPYLVNFKDRAGRTIANDVNGDWLKPAFQQMYRLLKPDSYCVSFYGWNAIDQFMAAWKSAGFSPVAQFVWHKPYASSKGYVEARHECAYLLIKGSPEKPPIKLHSVLPWEYTGNKLHPTQKPVSALKLMIKGFSEPGDLVLDPFSGSGSTAVAAHETGRDYLGFELDKSYHAVAVKRLKQVVNSVSTTK